MKFSPATIAAWPVAETARDKWIDLARSNQIPPEEGWDMIVWRAGRGFGKSRSLYEFLWWECWRIPGLIGHAVCPTLSDVKKVAFEGPIGLNSLIPAECVKNGSFEDAYNKSEHKLMLRNGSVIHGFSATEEAGRLRGPQCHVATGDELREWDKPAGNLESALTNVQLGCRLPYPDGTPARMVCATTPRSIPFLKRLYKRNGVLVITGSSYENVDNLAPSFRNFLSSLKGTKTEKIEVHGLDVDEEDDESIFKRSWFKLWPKDKKLPEFVFIVESYDTAFTPEDYDLKNQRADFTACIVLGVFNIGGYFSPQEISKYGLRGRYGVLVCDVWAARVGFPDLLEKARHQHRTKWGNPGRRADMVLIEEKAAGSPLRQSLAGWGVPTWKFNPGRQNKTIRGHAMAPVVKNGSIFVPESLMSSREGQPRDWCEPFLEQTCAYIVEGSVDHDDMYDAFVQGLHYLQAIDLLRVEPEVKYADPEEEREVKEKEAQRYYKTNREDTMSNPYDQ